MSVKMKFGSKDIPFVYKGDKLIYPNPIKDGLLLWYDFKGMRNTDTNKEVAKDLSGNGNDGTLTNFNFTEGSGYKDNTLVFDGVDDKLTIPELELNETAMTVMQDGKIYAYEDDKVLTVGEDGGIEARERNLIYNSKSPGVIDNTGWGTRIGEFNVEPNKEYYAKIYIKPYDFETSIQFVFRREDLSSIIESGAGNFIDVNQEGYVNLSYVAPEEASNAWIQLRHSERVEVINRVEVKDLIVSTSEDSPYSPAPEDYKTTSLSPSLLSNLQLYNRPLRKNELLQNTESKGLKKLKPGVIVQDGLVLHYDFSHESNTSEYKDKAFDYSGNGNHGELQNFNFTEESGYTEDGLKFDGVDDGIVTPNITLINSATIQTTFTLYSGTPYAPIFRIHVGRGVFFLGFNRVNDGVLWFGTNGDEGIVQHMSIHTLPINKKLVLTLVYNGEKSKVEVFVNGEKVVEGQHDIIPLNYVGQLFIGRQGDAPDRVMKADYNSLLYYNRALTPEEIQHNYQIEKEKFNIVEGDA